MKKTPTFTFDGPVAPSPSLKKEAIRLSTTPPPRFGVIVEGVADPAAAPSADADAAEEASTESETPEASLNPGAGAAAQTTAAPATNGIEIVNDPALAISQAGNQ